MAVGGLEAFEGVAGVVHHVALAPGPGHRQQVVVQDEDAQVGVGREALLDPGVATPADRAVVEVGLGGIDRDDRDAVDVDDGRALAEQLLEVDVADVARVVVARHDDHTLALELVEILARGLVLGAETVVGEVAADDYAVGLELVELGYRPLQQTGHEVRRPAMQVGDLGDGHVAVHPGSRLSPSSSRRSSRTLAVPRSASLMVRKSRTSATSCTRRIAAPASTPSPTAASVPASRSRGPRPVSAPRKSLRDTASRIGRPSCRSSPSRRRTSIVWAGVLAKSGPGSTTMRSSSTPRPTARAIRSRRNSSTS